MNENGIDLRLDDATAIIARRAGFISFWLTIVFAAPFYVLAGYIALTTKRDVEWKVLLASSPGSCLLLLSMFILRHRANAVDLTAYLVTALLMGQLATLIGFSFSDRKWLVLGIMIWTIEGIVLVAKLYTFQRILRPPPKARKLAFEVIPVESTTIPNAPLAVLPIEMDGEADERQ